MMTIDDGAPQYDPLYQIAIREWVDDEVEHRFPRIVTDEDGTERVEDEVVRVPAKRAAYRIEMRPLDEIKANVIEMLDQRQSEARSRLVTAGRDMVHIEKRDQANAVFQMGEEAANALTESTGRQLFPLLAASIGIDGDTLWDCSQVVIAKAEAWADRSYAIERAWLAGKKAVKGAIDEAGVRSAYGAVQWPT